MIVNGAYISDYISYSQLKTFDDEGPRGLIERKDFSNKSTRFGTLLDDYLFLSKDQFYDKYKVVQNVDLAEEQLTLAKAVKDEFTLEELDKLHMDDKLIDRTLALIARENLFNRIKKRETFISKFSSKDFINYVKELYTDKEIVPIRDFVFAQKCKAELFSSEKSKDYFVNDYENIYQSVIKFPYMDETVKCLLDMIIVDHDEKRIIPVDLKTGSPSTDNFEKNFFKYKYYLQASIYMLAAHAYNDINFNGEYLVEDFKFLYLCKYDIQNPVIYEVSDKWIQAGIKGFKTPSGFYYKGIDQLITELKWHKEHQKFDHSREIYENDVLALDDSFIIVDK